METKKMNFTKIGLKFLKIFLLQKEFQIVNIQ